jgi:DNA-binding NtrC family response regulator
MKKVVIIEDNQVIQQILKCWFIDEEFKVISLNRIYGLRQKIDLFKPDLIISDTKLPATEIGDLIKVIGSLKYPVIAISSTKDDDATTFATQIGAIASFTKPINLIGMFGFIYDHFNTNKSLTKKTTQR